VWGSKIKKMKKFTTIILILLGVTLVQAQNISYTLLSSDANEAVVRVDFGTYHTETVTVDGTEMQTLHMADAYPILKKGSPELLQTAFSLIVPEGSQPETEILDAQYTEIAHFALAPSKGKLYRNVNPATVPYTKNADYQTSNYLLSSAVQSNEGYQLRDYHGMSFKVYPFDYNPAAQTLKVYSSVTVKVRYHSTRTVSAPIKNNRTFDAIYANHFLNYNGFRSTPVAEEGDILIIAPENFIPAMQPYANWKIRNGFNTEIVPLATAGSTATAIKSYILNYYNEHNLAFVIIVGDNAQFPTPTVSGNKSDNYFTELVGDDSYPDIILGKISAENVSQVETQVQRFIEYEQNPSETAHFPVFAGIASDQGPGDNNEYDYQHIRNIDNKLQAYTYTSGYEFFEGSQGGLDASGNPTATMVGNAVNSGVGIITYCGHGAEQMWVTSSFSNNNVNNLTNVGKLPFILSVACVNGEYHSGTCFAEAWLRATYDGQPTGAVGFTGSTINQPWNSPMCAEDAMIDYLVGTNPAQQKFTYGGMFFNGMIKMLDTYNDVEVFRTWILFGDPVLRMRTAVPEQLAIAHNDVLPTGIPSVTFTSAVENAKITVTKSGEIIGVGNITNGEYTFTFTNTYIPTDTLHVLATATNYLPYEGTINFIPNEGPYLIVGNLSLVEKEMPFSSDIQNGLAEYGEKLEAKPQIVNLGNSASGNVHIQFSTDDPYITLTGSTTLDLSPIAAHDTLNAANGIVFKVDDQAPANHSALIQVTIIFNNDTVKQNKSIKLYAPDMRLPSMSIDDSQLGNGNHKADYGETFECTVTLANNGNMPITGGVLFLTNPGDELILPSETLPIPPVGANSTAVVTFPVTVRESVQEPTIAHIKTVLYVNSYRVSAYFPIKISEVAEDWETGDFSNMNWQNTSSTPWTIITQYPYEGTYCAKSGNIGNNATTTLKITDTATVTDTISFYYKVSSEQDYDKLIFKIDGQTKDEWSGNIGWTRAAYPVSAGIHTYTWSYTKDYYGTSGHDCAYLDAISFPCGKVNAPVSVEDFVQQPSTLQVWPNPTTDIVRIQLGEDAQDYTYQLFSLTGKLLQGGRLVDSLSEIDMRNYVSGTYILRVESSDHQVQTAKIIKK